MVGGWPLPRRFEGVSPLWRPGGHRDRAVFRRVTAGALAGAVLVPAVAAPSVHGVWGDVAWYVLCLAAPAWSLVAFLASLLSLGAWSSRANVVLSSLIVAVPLLVSLGLGVGWIFLAPMVAASALATWATWERRWRSPAVHVSG